MRMIPIMLCFAALGACQAGDKDASSNEPAATSRPSGPVKGVDRSHKGKPAPDATFLGPDGDETSIADMKGPVLVNLWASWCAPCVKELPTLDALSRRLDSNGKLAVVAVSEDSGPQASVEAFLEKLKVGNLAAYHDPKMALSGALGPDAVLPTTILFDADGKEVWRFVGDLDWTGPEAAKLLSEAGGPTKG